MDGKGLKDRIVVERREKGEELGRDIDKGNLGGEERGRNQRERKWADRLRGELTEEGQESQRGASGKRATRRRETPLHPSYTHPASSLPLSSQALCSSPPFLEHHPQGERPEVRLQVCVLS